MVVKQHLLVRMWRTTSGHPGPSAEFRLDGSGYATKTIEEILDSRVLLSPDKPVVKRVSPHLGFIPLAGEHYANAVDQSVYNRIEHVARESSVRIKGDLWYSITAELVLVSDGRGVEPKLSTIEAGYDLIVLLTPEQFAAGYANNRGKFSTPDLYESQLLPDGTLYNEKAALLTT